MEYTDCWYMSSCPKCPNECGPTCIRFIEFLNLVQTSNLPESCWFPKQLSPGEDYDAFVFLNGIKKDIVNWVKQGNGLYIFSKQFGNGKTSWAIKLMLAYFNEVWAGNAFRTRAIFVSVPEFIDRNKETMNNRDPEFLEIRDNILNCDLVIWDDITSTRLTDYSHSLLLNYIDARVLANKANIFTGNVGFDAMQTSLGGRLTSRVWNSSSVVEFFDEDKRGIK